MSDFLNPHLTRPAVRWTSGNALPAVEQTGPAAPLLVDAATGRLLVDTEANLSADLSDIESKQDTTNALLTTTAADVAAVKTQLATGSIAVTGGGGGGGGASAAYNATLPTYISGASTTLQTDVNGRLITTGPLTDTQLRSSAVPVSVGNLPATQPVSAASLPLPSGAATESGNLATIAAEAVIIDAKLPALSSGRVPVEANNAASQVYSFTQTGAIAANTVLIGPIECSQFREVSVHVVALGTGATAPIAQVSNDGTNWVTVFSTNTTGGTAGSNLGLAGNLSSISLYSARNFRIISAGVQTAGTTTLVAYASQQTTPKALQNVVVTGSVGSQPTISNNIGYSLYHTLVSAASTNATSVKTSSASIGTLILTNSSATWAYFKLVNKSSTPTVGTDTAVINVGVAPNSTLDCSSSFAGLRMSIGLAYYVSAGTSLTDNTALPAAGTFLVNMTYV